MCLFPKGVWFSMTGFLNKENIVNCIFILLLASVIWILSCEEHILSGIWLINMEEVQMVST